MKIIIIKLSIILYAFIVFIFPLVILWMQLYTQNTQWHHLNSQDSISSTTIQLKLNKQELQRYLLSNERELIMDGHLYDIIQCKQLNDVFVLTLVEDEKENLLIKILRHIKHADWSLYTLLWMYFPTYIDIYIKPFLTKHIILSIYQLRICETYIAVTTPPPKI